LFVLSAAPLAFQVVLTRLFALAQGHHFAFMAISLALLGGGASGTFLSLRPPRGDATRYLTASACLFALAVPASYLLVNAIPFDMYRIVREPVQIGWLALQYVVLTVPFFFSGLAVGSALVAWPEHAHRLYAANLLGSAVGSPLALAALALLGGPRAALVLALAGCVAFWLFQGACRPEEAWRWRHIPTALLIVLCGALLALPLPLIDVRLNPYQALSQVLLFPDTRVMAQTWNAFSRVDVVGGDSIHSAPGLSMAFREPLPPRVAVVVDGQNLMPIYRTSAEAATFTAYLPAALAYQLRPQAEVLIVEPGGWLPVLTALHHAVRRVTVVQSNPAVAEVVRTWGDSYGYDPRVQLVLEDVRSFLRRDSHTYDLVVLPLVDSFRPVTAGAYALNEEYRYTVEAFQEMWAHLSVDGLLVAERWLQLPPSESLRLWALAVDALRRSGVAHPPDHLLALRSLQTSLILVSRSPLRAAEQATAKTFAVQRQYDLLWTPDLAARTTVPDTLLALSDAQLAEAGINRFNVIPDAPHFKAFVRLLFASDEAAFYRAYPYAVHPPTDDRPFFFHFFKWEQTPAIIAALGKTWQPFGGSGYLVFVLLLGLVVILAAALILLPLGALRRRLRTDARDVAGEKRGGTLRYLVYFALLGLGFMCVEMPLLQRFILYVGQPAYAFATAVSALLLASGLGSRYLSLRIPPQLGMIVLVGLGLAYPALLSSAFDAAIALPLVARAVLGGLMLMPLGMLMGLPFPQGLADVRTKMRALLPWVWAVNGSVSVVSAVLAPMLAIDGGFRMVMFAGAAAYGVAWLVLWAPWARFPIPAVSEGRRTHRPS
jgi:spermidine synthase